MSLLLALALSGALAQSARQQPEPGYTPSPPAAEHGNAYGNSFQGIGQATFGTQLPAGTSFGPARQAGTGAQPTTPQGRVQPTDLSRGDPFPVLSVRPGPGPHARRPEPAYSTPLPPLDFTPQPPPVHGGNIRRVGP